MTSSQEQILALKPAQIQGVKFIRPLCALLERLHRDAPNRNRVLHHDQLLALLLLASFNPIVKSLRDLEAFSGLRKIQKKLDIPRLGKSTLAEAFYAFDPNLLAPVVRELAARVPGRIDPALADLKQVLTAVDGTCLRALPRVAWALGVGGDREGKSKAAKLHLHFDVLRGVPDSLTLAGKGLSETQALRAALEPGRLYVIDRGYAKYDLFEEIRAAGSSFVGRLCKDAVMEKLQERPLTDADRAAGVVADAQVRLGGKGRLVLRVVTLEIKTRTGTTRFLLACDRLDLPAETIAVIYRYRWQVELFFRWLKCTLGFGHLLSDSQTGVAIQVYAAIIATLLVAIVAGGKPDRRTYVMVGLYLQGLADLDELTAFLAKKRR